MNTLELFNELCVYLSTLHLVFFTDWVPTPELQAMYGWSMLLIIGLNIIVNLTVTFWQG
jgi:hypothetical protein